jgi:hypothetical protein
LRERRKEGDVKAVKIVKMMKIMKMKKKQKRVKKVKRMKDPIAYRVASVATSNTARPALDKHNNIGNNRTNSDVNMFNNKHRRRLKKNKSR